MDFKNIKRLYSRDDVHNFVLSVWKTELFRNLHSKGLENVRSGHLSPLSHTFVSKIVDDFAKLPRFTFTMTDANLEWAHFSTWWGGIPQREVYDNPYIHDLYWIHEMAHAGNMVYVPNMNLANFERKMTDNELHASVVSEIQVYFEIPELRKLSFPHRIYADTFLQDKEFVKRYIDNPTLTFEEMKVRRRDTMMDANPQTKSDFWIHRFYTQNAAWVACWAHSYNKVETAMAILRDISNKNVTRPELMCRDDYRRQALDTFLDVFIKDNTGGHCIPFYREAQAFSGVYWANRAHYDESFKTP